MSTGTERLNLITFKEALERLRCKTTKVYKLINAGKIIAYRDGGRTLIDADSVDAYQGSLERIGPRTQPD